MNLKYPVYVHLNWSAIFDSIILRLDRTEQVIWNLNIRCELVHSDSKQKDPCISAQGEK